MTVNRSLELGQVLVHADPGHPWPEGVETGAFDGGQLSVALTRVDPTAVVEVSADPALSAGVVRHPLWFVQLRPDLSPGDVAGT